MIMFSLLVHLLLYWIPVWAKLTLSPEKLSVLRGEEARFTCSTSYTGWTVMLWLLNGSGVLTISNETGALPSVDPNVMAEKVPLSKGDSWVFVLKQTERHNQGQVTCDLQGIERKTASLFVQEAGSVKVSGDNNLAFKGKLVLFECRAEGWHPQPIIQWQVDDKKVSKDEYNISREESEKGLFTVNSNLSMTAAKSSYVHCLASVSALPEPLKSSVRLTVVAEVVQEGGDCTVLLAVTTSLSAFLLILLLCICTVLWYRQRRQASPHRETVRKFTISESKPQDEIRCEQSVRQRDLVTEVSQGEVNLGYSGDVLTDAVYSDIMKETGSSLDFSFHKVPDVVSSSTLSLHTESQAQMCLSDESPMNIRRITTV